MISVHLHNLQFHAFHGIHDEERIIGNDYILNVSVDFFESQKVIVSINETINYTDIYNIIMERMNVPTQLLETVIMEIGNEIKKEFPELKSINISLTKMNPPIEGIQGQAGVSWLKQF